MIKRLAIVFPNPSPHWETFIQAHVDNLPFEKKLLYGGWFPYFAEGNVILAQPGSLFTRSLRKVISILLKRRSPNNAEMFRKKALLRYLKLNKIDGVLAEYGPTGAEIADVCNQAKIPLIVHFHGFDAYHLETLSEYGKYARLFEVATSLIAVSQEMKEQLISIGATASKVYYNPYGVDTNKFKPNPVPVIDPIFFFVGRFVNKKAPQLLILAFERVRKFVPDARLILGGDGGQGRTGELYDACKQMVAALNLKDSVVFKGSLTHEEVLAEMKRAMAYVQHSIHAVDGDAEGLPNSILEACAVGLPVIATNHAGIPDVIADGKNGYLVNEGDIDHMARRMIELANNPGLARQMGMTGRKIVTDGFSLERSIAGLSEIIENAD